PGLRVCIRLAGAKAFSPAVRLSTVIEFSGAGRMPVAPKSTQELEPQSSVPAPVRAQVREQLDRLLAHSLFANSKRYPALLAYVVEQTLLGNAADLKERSIGIEVFGRAPTYDANADPIVRITAGEVRKRLSQYYYGHAHRSELVIELPIGSYVPVCHFTDAPTPTDTVESAPLLAPEFATPLPAAETAPASPHPRFLWPFIVATALLAGVAGAAVGWRMHRPASPPPPSSIDRFWQPFIASANPATFCLGEPGKVLNTTSLDNFNAPAPQPLLQPQPAKPDRPRLSGSLALADVITLTRAAAALEARHKTFRVVAASTASFAQLREGPIVLIGALDNIWTLRVTQKLRFGFESKDGDARIVDRKNPGDTSWTAAWNRPGQSFSRDYAIVARIHDHVTGQPVVIAAGISEEGTQAAGEILYNPLLLNALLAHAPQDWEQKNLEGVIETQITQGHPGPPQVLAVDTW
ncbi:MAG: hypothetical protein WBF42_14040, partial [Terracidiphilus sp.]